MNKSCLFKKKMQGVGEVEMIRFHVVMLHPTKSRRSIREKVFSKVDEALFLQKDCLSQNKNLI